MTAAALRDLDLTRLRAAIERLDLPGELRRLDLDRLDLYLPRMRAAIEDLDLPHVDVARLRAAIDELDLPRVDLPHVDLADLRRPAGLGTPAWRLPTGSVLVGAGALLGGVVAGGLLAFLLHPTRGPQRRRTARRRLGRLARRVLGRPQPKRRGKRREGRP